MVRRLFIGLLVVWWPAWGFAQTPSEPAASKPSPMKFEWVREGPVETCRDKCREWISASGSITESTPRDFEAFAQGRNIQGATIVLESTGGVVLPALKLGQIFRRLDVTTTVGKTVKIPINEAGVERTTIAPRAFCNSMCVFLLLGGARRHVPEEARVLVHQIWPSSKREDAAAATYTAANMVTTQRILGQIARYTVEMGAHIELFEMTTRFPPWEGPRPLTGDELRRLRVHTADSAFDRVSTPSGASVSVPAPPVNGTRTVSLEQGWTLVDRAGRRALARRHPLTIEGQQIGSFEISFACGDRADVYQVAYLDKRKSEVDNKIGRLETVGILVGKERVLLKLEPSGAEGSPAELVSVARGIMPSALVTAFAAANGPSLFIRTMTAKKVQTTIRVGNTGLTQNLSRMTAECPK